MLARTLARRRVGTSTTTIAGNDGPHAEEGPLTIVYECRSVAGPCRLRLNLSPGGLLTGIFWATEQGEREITDESVEVYSG